MVAIVNRDFDRCCEGTLSTLSSLKRLIPSRIRVHRGDSVTCHYGKWQRVGLTATAFVTARKLKLPSISHDYGDRAAVAVKGYDYCLGAGVTNQSVFAFRYDHMTTERRMYTLPRGCP